MEDSFNRANSNISDRLVQVKRHIAPATALSERFETADPLRRAAASEDGGHRLPVTQRPETREGAGHADSFLHRTPENGATRDYFANLSWIEPMWNACRTCALSNAARPNP